MTAATQTPPLMVDGNGTVNGRRLLATIVISAAMSALIGTAIYYGFQFLAPAFDSVLKTQLIVAVVYSTLIAAFLIAFPALGRAPLEMRFTSGSDLALAGLAWLGLVVFSSGIYFLLNPLFGSIPDATRQLLTVATDAKRLQGQIAPATWAISIARGCFIVPVFEELLFRGLLLGWLRKRLSVPVAITVSAALFAVMHGYPIALPYTFVFGLFTGWIRVRTGSTLNTLFMHILNNLFFLYLGFSLLR